MTHLRRSAYGGSCVKLFRNWQLTRAINLLPRHFRQESRRRFRTRQIECASPFMRCRSRISGCCSHCWSAGITRTAEDVLSTYEAQYGDAQNKSSEILDELTEAFVTMKGTTQAIRRMDPSELSRSSYQAATDGGSLKSEFLNRMNMAGIKLALSNVDDSTGRARFQLISSADDWETLQRRALEVARRSGVAHCADLLTVLVAAIDSSLGRKDRNC